jgi:hypothetical protein
MVGLRELIDQVDDFLGIAADEVEVRLAVDPVQQFAFAAFFSLLLLGGVREHNVTRQNSIGRRLTDFGGRAGAWFPDMLAVDIQRICWSYRDQVVVSHEARLYPLKDPPTQGSAITDNGDADDARGREMTLFPQPTERKSEARHGRRANCGTTYFWCTDESVIWWSIDISHRSFWQINPRLGVRLEVRADQDKAEARI